MRLQNSVAEFQWITKTVLGYLKIKILWAFVDDERIGTDDVGPHFIENGKILGRMWQSEMKLKLRKFRFGAKYVEFLGNKVTNE